MDSWWQLGEWSGVQGSDLDLSNLECPFCSEKGNFETVFHIEKKKPNGQKVLNFDTLQCGNCASFVQVFWSGSREVHSYRIQPWPLKLDKHPDHWPPAVGRFWLQAKRNLKEENWDASAVMARSSLQVALREQDAKGKNLFQEIDDLATKGILPNIIKDWAHNVRELGNESAHPQPDQAGVDPKDASDIVKFLDFLLEYLYSLPHRINQFRNRKGGEG